MTMRWMFFGPWDNCQYTLIHAGWWSQCGWMESSTEPLRTSDHYGDWVTATDYEHLLALYREVIAPDLKFWPCKEKYHSDCAGKKWIECSCECHRNGVQSVVK